MKIAIPVKTNKKNPAVAPLFGKAKWFAFIENDGFTIHENPSKGGKAVIEWFANEGVDTIIMQEMGLTPYEMIQDNGNMTLYHSGYDRIVLDDLIAQFADGELEMLDDRSMKNIIKQHERRHIHVDHYHGANQHKHHQN